MPTAPRPATAQQTDATLARLLATSQASFDADHRAEQAFIARGLRAVEQARQTGRYVSARAVLQQLTHALATTCRRAPP